VPSWNTKQSKAIVRLPRSRLPVDAAERHGVLRRYFCDKDATAVLDGDQWRLSLAWPGGAERHVDPRLETGLRWWDAGLDLSAMALQRRRQGRVLTALYDTWTLHSWSDWLTRNGHGANDPLVVLHVDDHRDLGSPRVFLSEGGGWKDAITGHAVSMRDPASVLSAIESGAIGMGSFLTPWLHALSRVDVRHLCQPPKAPATQDFHFARTVEADSMLLPGAQRLAIVLEKASGRVGCSYRITPDMVEWTHGLGAGPILVHIDMDYFNNRYDGDSDWQNRHPIFDPPEAEINARIDELADALSAPGIASRIQDIVVAYSPGFFPAEYWQRADEQLKRRLGFFYER
jgi:hypothetical protein